MSKTKEKPITLTITTADLRIVVEALDSHAYWQLSDEHYRSDGFVEDPGSDDPGTAQTIADTNALHDRLERLAMRESRKQLALKKTRRR